MKVSNSNGGKSQCIIRFIMQFFLKFESQHEEHMRVPKTMGPGVQCQYVAHAANAPFSGFGCFEDLHVPRFNILVILQLGNRYLKS